MPTSPLDATPSGLRLCGVCTLAVVVLFVSTAAAAPESPLIASARVEAIGPAHEEAILGVLELQVGKPLDEQRLREVIMTLYAGGDVEWLRVEAAESPAGYDVVVRISYRSTISQIKVHAKSPILRVKIHRWLPVSYTHLRAHET